MTVLLATSRFGVISLHVAALCIAASLGQISGLAAHIHVTSHAAGLEGQFLLGPAVRTVMGADADVAQRASF